jgi:PAS domain-containing protein
VATWPATGIYVRVSRETRLAHGEGLPGRVWASGQPAWIADVRAEPNFPRRSIAARVGLRTGLCFPTRGTTGALAAMEFLVAEEREPDGRLLATMTSLGTRIGHCAERWQAERRLRESEARKSAILNAALDCIITMDARGVVVEVNEAAERAFRYTAAEMVGQDLAELIIPPARA